MKRALVLLVVPLFLLAACGGDDDDAGGATDTSTEVADTDASESDEAESEDTESDEAEGTDEDNEWCRLAAEVEETNNELDDIDFTDPGALQEVYERFVDQIEDIRDEAPEEIADDIEQLADGSRAFLEALSDADFNFVDVDLEAIEELSDEMEEASANVEAYNEEVCGIPAESDDTADSDGDATDGTIDTSEGTIREQLVDQFTSAGFTDEEANCLVDVLDFNDESVQAGDQTAILEAFGECDIDISRLAEIGGG